MSSSFSYFGHNSLTDIYIGSGKSAWRRWGLMDHAGPIFRLDYLGFFVKRYTYLPPHLLELLYQRFRSANPDGATLDVNDEFEDSYLDGRFSKEEQELMFDRREALFSINEEKVEEGYPCVRPYLPELFEAEIVDQLACDPWLDVQLLKWAEFLGPSRGGIRHDLWVDRSARWSCEWRVFCDELTPLDWSPRNSWKESTLNPESKLYKFKDEKIPYWLT